MHRLLLLGLCLFAAASMQSEAKVANTTPTQAKAPKHADNSDCYTVVLFTKVKIQKPAKDVPLDYREYLGRWGAGAWNDVWCHELMIYDVEANGRVQLVEMHAPYDPWHQPAMAFRRTAQIEKDGSLHLDYAKERIVYRLENGVLAGTRRGVLGTLKVALQRLGKPPFRLPNPLRTSPRPIAKPVSSETGS